MNRLIVPKNLRGGTLREFSSSILLQSIKLKGTLWRHLKILKKTSQCQKNENGDPLVSSGFVCYLQIGKNERGPFALRCVSTGRSSSFCKKCPLRIHCYLTKKKQSPLQQSRSFSTKMCQIKQPMPCEVRWPSCFQLVYAGESETEIDDSNEIFKKPCIEYPMKLYANTFAT